jgi:lipopolysaccharide/colanic/teichoic acid biosynthesis glycosyltransferase
MSELYDTSSPLDVYSGTTAGREFYVQPAASASDSHAEERAIQSEISDERQVECPCASYFSVKAAVDRLITVLLMIVALPLMMVIGLAILILDGRPVFYRQTRVGKRGREYRMWKFRTMCHDAESKTGAVWSTDADPRVTTLGRWLRCSHLDELPQFFNVLIGDMNLIGPRPERPEFVQELTRQLPSYEQRLSARPGITGLAQLRLGYDQSVADVQRKLTLDLEYIRTASFIADAKIVLSTFPYIASRLVGKWKTDPGANDDLNTTAPGVDGEQERATELRRPDQARSADLGPHVFPSVSTGTNINLIPQAGENL